MVKLILSIIMCLSLTSLTAQEISLKQELINLGQIKKGTKEKSFELELRNSGTKPLIILGIDVSCRCTTIDFSKKPILPGEITIVKMSYEPEKKTGSFHKAIQITANTPQGRHIAAFKGEIID